MAVDQHLYSGQAARYFVYVKLVKKLDEKLDEKLD